MNMTPNISREEIENILATKTDEIGECLRDYLRDDTDQQCITGDVVFNASLGEYMVEEYNADDVEIKEFAMAVTDYSVTSEGDIVLIKGTVCCSYKAEALVLYQGDTMPTGDFIEGDQDISFEINKAAGVDHWTCSVL